MDVNEVRLVDTISRCTQCGVYICSFNGSDRYYSSMDMLKERKPSLVPLVEEDEFTFYKDVVLSPRRFWQIPACPLCGNVSDPSQRIWQPYLAVANDALEWKKAIKLKCNEFVNSSKESMMIPVAKVETDSVNIPQILELYIQTETNLCMYSDLLENALYSQTEYEKLTRQEAALRTKIDESIPKRFSQLQQKCSEIESEIQKKTEELGELDRKFIPITEDAVAKSVSFPEPLKPKLKKPFFFNKKRIEEINAAKMWEYNQELLAYQVEIQQRTDRKNRELLRKRAKEEERLITHIEELRQTQQQACNDIAFLESICSKTTAIEASPYAQQIAWNQAEIEDIKEKIMELCKIHAQIVSSGVIHSKYLNIVAVTTIAEYFETGRCDKLTGPDGAYNLYEAEIRANRIIAQLDKVITSLDVIKENQYRTYQVLSQMQKDIQDMSTMFSRALSSLENIAMGTDAIKETAEIIAYNTAKTAHYAKTNAELTNALGYLIALH